MYSGGSPQLPEGPPAVRNDVVAEASPPPAQPAEGLARLEAAPTTLMSEVRVIEALEYLLAHGPHMRPRRHMGTCGHGRARGGGVDESDNESDDEAADESDVEATGSEDPGLDVDEAGDAASDAEDDLPLSALRSAMRGV
eukprot:365912-Chlamydomonas_euryale.AAC.6